MRRELCPACWWKGAGLAAVVPGRGCRCHAASSLRVCGGATLRPLECSRGFGLALCRLRLRSELKTMEQPATVQPCLTFRCTALWWIFSVPASTQGSQNQQEGSKLASAPLGALVLLCGRAESSKEPVRTRGPTFVIEAFAAEGTRDSALSGGRGAEGGWRGGAREKTEGGGGAV